MEKKDVLQSRRLFLKWGASAGVAAALSPMSVLADPQQTARWLWVGGVTDSRVVVRARFGSAVQVRLAVSRQSSFSSPRYSSFKTAQSANNWVVPLSVSGLSPNTVYHYAIEQSGTIDTSLRGTFKTFPAAGRPASFSFVCGHCAGNGSNAAVFDTMRNQAPLFMIHMGDLFYQNISANDRSLFRAAYNQALAAPRQAALYRNVPTVYMWDDHDFGPNNSDRNAPGREAARLTYQEYVPHYPLIAGSGNVPIYHAFTVGRVRFLVTDFRSERTPYTAADNSSKTMFGSVQKQWFKQELLDAQGQYPVIFWVNSMPWIGTSGSDGWHNYTVERREIANFIKANNIKGLVMLAGDAHMIAIDDGSNSGYADGGGGGFPVFHSAAFDSSGSLKGGPYSHGAFPGSGQFGKVTITDAGNGSIQVRLSGRNTANQEVLGLTLTLADTTLPVEWTNFQAIAVAEDVVLLWDTASETDNTGFEVQMNRTAGPETAWEPLTWITGAGTTTEAQHYHYRVHDLAPGAYKFRLKQVDADGAFAYSEVVEAVIEFPSAYVLRPAYPNPFAERATIQFGVQVTQPVTVALYDLQGREVQTLFDGVLAGGTILTRSLNGADLSQGRYVVRMAGAEFSTTQAVLCAK